MGFGRSPKKALTEEEMAAKAAAKEKAKVAKAKA